MQALRNFADIEEFTSVVYAKPEYIDTLATSTPASAHVEVDYQLQGCPIDRGQLLETLASLLVGRKPRLPAKTVCTECKNRGVTCVVVAEGIPCLGPVTHAGCGALCPTFHRGCYGCFGPAATPNTAALIPGAAPRRHVRRRRRAGVLDVQRRPVHRRAERRMNPEIRTLSVGALTRVEGEGALHVTMSDGAVDSVELNIYEPPRFFEAFLRGREYTEPPDITARVCGICPVAYQVSACNAIEDACGVTVDPQLVALRRLLYCGEWIHSHALHIYLLHVPDFLGYPDAISLAKDRPELIERGLALKKAGNRLMEQIGGRAIHPVNVRLGGFYSVPTTAELRPLAEMLRAHSTMRCSRCGRSPNSTSRMSNSATNCWRSPSPTGTRSKTARFREARDRLSRCRSSATTSSRHRYSTPPPCTQPWTAAAILTGPLARYSLNSSQLSPVAGQAATDAGLGVQCRNPFRSIVVRAVEVVYAIEEALRIIAEYERPARPCVEVPARAGVGHGVSEAPRGLLYHRYEIGDDGLVQAATMVPPTAQNQAAIEHEMAGLVAANLNLDDETLTTLCEKSIRNHDPCISCSAHFLTLTVDRR